MNSIPEDNEKVKLIGEVNECLLSLVRTSLASHHYRMRDVHVSDGYFVFEGAPCSVIRFRVRKAPGFLFGLWLDGENLLPKKAPHPWDDGETERLTAPVIRIFAQYEAFVDKFKPSASDLCVTIDVWAMERMMSDEGDNGWVASRLASVVGCAVRHPGLTTSGSLDPEWPIVGHPMAAFVREAAIAKASAKLKGVREAYWLGWARRKRSELEQDPDVHETWLEHEGEPGWYPYVSLCVALREGLTDEEEVDAVNRHFDTQRPDDCVSILIRAGSGESRGWYEFFEGEPANHLAATVFSRLDHLLRG